MNKSNVEMTYTEAIQRLEQIVSDLESGSISIDTLEEVILESRNLVALCEEKLRRLENSIEGMDNDKTL